MSTESPGKVSHLNGYAPKLPKPVSPAGQFLDPEQLENAEHARKVTLHKLDPKQAARFAPKVGRDPPRKLTISA